MPRLLYLWVLLRFGLAAQPAPGVVDLKGGYIDPLRNPGARAVVLIFMRTDCPISNRYAPEIRRLHDLFSPKAVAFWLVYPGARESVDAIRRHVEEFGYRCDVLLDPRHSLVRTAKAKITPEAAVFVPGRRLVYHGRIDDRYVDFGKMRPAPTMHDLELVLESILANKPAPVAVTHAVGCFISDLQ
jgi:AhpC/TSA family protein